MINGLWEFYATSGEGDYEKHHAHVDYAEKMANWKSRGKKFHMIPNDDAHEDISTHTFGIRNEWNKWNSFMLLSTLLFSHSVLLSNIYYVNVGCKAPFRHENEI